MTLLFRLQAFLVLLLSVLSSTPAVEAAPPPGAGPGRVVYERANCIGCHKWHGGGGGGYGGAALSLRETQLDREQIVEVVRCGRPSTGMPYHDRGAYSTTECYGGMGKEDLGKDAPPTARTFLRPEEIEAVTDYLVTTLKGKGEPTREDCIAFWGSEARECKAMQPK